MIYLSAAQLRAWLNRALPMADCKATRPDRDYCMSGQPWAASELSYLERNADTKDIFAMAADLKRTPHSVEAKLYQLRGKGKPRRRSVAHDHQKSSGVPAKGLWQGDRYDVC